MIVNNGMKSAAFVSAIACTIGRRSSAAIEAEQLTRDTIENTGEGVIYLGGGYWRGVPYWGEGVHSDRIEGLTLINPDRTADECRTVERGIGILIHCEVR